jgi:hypothetical protein
MKKITLPLIFAGLFLVQAPSYADWMQGVVQGLEGKTVTINRTDDSGNDSDPRQLKVKILDNAKLKNISAVEDLKNGQEIKVDARNNKEQGFWDANYVELIQDQGAQQGQAQQNEAQKPSEAQQPQQ